MNKQHSDELRETVLDDYAAGMSTATIGRLRGISAKTVNNWVRDAGISRTLAEAKDAERALLGGHWTPNSRGVQIWQPCFYPSIHACNINHQENPNAA